MDEILDELGDGIIGDDAGIVNDDDEEGEDDKVKPALDGDEETEEEVI